ncbi:MAG: thioredoxin family protein [Dehalococcoidia bacterium]|nr:thioredoxin family protein [Dehalococcoidia bacterium]
MVQQTSVVTPERFVSGLTYKEYIAQIKVNIDRFEDNLKTAHVSPEDTAFLRKVSKLPNGPTKMLVLGEDWCPDVYRGMPILHRIAEAGGMEMRIFPRDQHLDIMNEFLKEGQFLSIPTAVFYTKDHRYILHWIERPEAVNRERPELLAAVKREMPNADEQTIRTVNGQRSLARYPAWQQETVREIREMLTQKLGL